jgi:hypothetical protein
MEVLLVGGAAFALGSAMMAGLAAWHQRKLRTAVAAERRAEHDERSRLQGRVDKLQDDKQFYRDKAASIQAEQDLAAEYDRGYLEGIRYGMDMDEVERMAYNLDQKQPARILRMHRHKEGRICG